jgi:methyl-accepting chemotaxis protein
MLAVVLVAGIAMALTGWMASSNMRDTRYAEREQATRHMVEAGLSLIGHHAARAAAGEVTVEVAQQEALAAVKDLRYGADDYFWIHDEQLVMQMHPFKPQLDGTDISGVEDPEGVRLFVEMNEVVAADGAGFVPYQWPKPGLEEPQPKISYVAGFPDWGWIIGSGVYVDDVESAVAADSRGLGALFFIGGAVILGVILLVRSSITRRLNHMASVLETGDLSTRLDEGRRHTELDRLAAAINSNLARVRSVVDGVVQASGSVQDQVRQLTTATGRMGHQVASTAQEAGAASTSSREVIEGYDRVTEAVTDIDTSIRTISDNAQKVAAVADNAVEIADRTNDLVSRLGDSSGEIGDVVRTITTIAEKTNLLALNATIESSRAGEAGRGFAVVANEVKELAKATASATEGIANQIQALQVDAGESVSAIAEISRVIAELNEYQTGIAAAVEEQAVTMAEVSQGVVESSQAGAGTGTAIESLASAAVETREQLSEVSSNVEALGRISNELQETVSVFAR